MPFLNLVVMDSPSALLKFFLRSRSTFFLSWSLKFCQTMKMTNNATFKRGNVITMNFVFVSPTDVDVNLWTRLKQTCLTVPMQMHTWEMYQVLAILSFGLFLTVRNFLSRNVQACKTARGEISTQAILSIKNNNNIRLCFG